MSAIMFVVVPMAAAFAVGGLLQLAWPKPIEAEKEAQPAARKRAAAQANALEPGASKPIRGTPYSANPAPRRTRGATASKQVTAAAVPVAASTVPVEEAVNSSKFAGAEPEQSPTAFSIPDDFNIHEFQGHREAA